MNGLQNNIAVTQQPQTESVMTSLETADEHFVRQTYQDTFSDEVVESLSLFPKTQESIVAEVNQGYIVKIPRAKRGSSGIRIEKQITDLIRDKSLLELPNITLYEKPQPIARYPKISGCNFDKKWYLTLDDENKEALAQQLVQFLVTMHSVDIQQVELKSIEFSPSWELAPKFIQQQLGKKTELAIKATLSTVLANHAKLQVPKSSLVLGHFDMHGGNVLVDKEAETIAGIIDFGNCKIGDIHQEFSVMNLSSPDLAKRMLQTYQRKTGRSLNPLLVQHYTTIFYLHLLAAVDGKKQTKLYQHWLIRFTQWYQYLVDDRANAKLNPQQPLSAMSDTDRQWLASQMMRGVSSSLIHHKLQQQGFSDIDIRTEIKQAQQHPYIKAGTNIADVLDKRNWLLATNNALASLDERYDNRIEVRKTPDFNTFIRDYYSKQLPVVFTDGIKHWSALKKWTPEYFIEQVGSAEIEVQYGRENDPLYERNSKQLKKCMSMKTYAEMILQGGESNNYYMTARNTKSSLSGIECLFDDVDDFGPVTNGGKGYRNTETVNSANLLWFGPKGTVTPIHHDLTNNMLVQIYGRKKVTLIPAFQVPNMYNDKGVYSAADYPDFDKEQFPLLNNVSAIEIILNPGDTIFIPIAWWHRVESLDVSISTTFINFDIPNQFSRAFPGRGKQKEGDSFND